MCVNHHKWWVLRFLLLSFAPPYFPIAKVLSSTLLPLLHRPWVFSTSLRICHLFSQRASGSPNRSGFIMPLTVISIRSVGQPFSKTYSLPVSRPAPYRFVSLRPPWLGLDIGTRLLRSACSTPLYHIAGSLFATYTGSTSWFRWGRLAPRGITANAVALLVSLFRPERRAVFSCLLVSSHQDIGLYIMPGAPRLTSGRPCPERIYPLP